MQNASGAPKDGNETDPQVPFCANQIGMLSAPGWVKGTIIAPEADGRLPEGREEPRRLRPAGHEAGQSAPVFLGGSNIAIAAKSKNQELAYNLLKVLLSDGSRPRWPRPGWCRPRRRWSVRWAPTRSRKATAQAATNTKLTPAAPGWANVESDKIMEDLFVNIAGGGDVAALAKAADEKITAALNR